MPDESTPPPESDVLKNPDARLSDNRNRSVVGLQKVHGMNPVERGWHGANVVTELASANVRLAALGQPVIQVAEEVSSDKPAKSSQNIRGPLFHIMLGVVAALFGYPLGWLHASWRAMQANDPSSATRPAGRVDCNRDAMAGFAAAHG
jgi:hypothetical protein